MPVGELLERISSREISEWIAYDQVEPIGEARADLRLAMLMSLIATIHRDPDKHPQPYELEEVMLNYWQRVEPVDPAESWRGNLAIAELVTTALGGQDLREKG